MSASIELQHLTKRYGRSRGIEDVTFSVNQGEVLGFLGPNGAGKTTAIRVLAGLIHATSGTASVLGYDTAKRSPKMLNRIGYLPGSYDAYRNLTANEFLDWVGRMRHLDISRLKHQLADRFELDLRKHIHDLSKGNRQKVGVVMAFMHNPDVLILDEPTSGLDPLVQREFELLLAESKARGAAILLSSHVLSDVEHLADRVAIINQGKLVLLDSISALKQRATRSLELAFAQPVNADWFAGLPGVKKVDVVGNRLICSVEGVETEVLRVAAENGVETVTSRESSLDEIFYSAIGGAGR